MDRFFRLLLSLCLVFCLLPVPAYAASSTAYILDDLAMYMELPSELVVFTRDTNADDPNLSAYELTEDSLSSYMEEESMYLDAWDKDVTYEIIVTKESSPILDYAGFNDAELNAFLSFFEEKYTAEGFDFVGAGLYRPNQIPFMRIYASIPEDGGTPYSLTYHTVHDNQAINIILYSNIGRINPDMEALMQTLADSVYFDASLRGRSLIQITDPFLYTDPESGLSFTVPECWINAPQFGDPEHDNAAFQSIREDGLFISFSSEDLFSESNWDGSQLARIMTPRASLDHSSLTEYDIASSLGCSEEEISTFPYRGKEYYVAETTMPLTIDSLTFTIPTTYLIRCENGYLYMFQFTATRDNPHFTDLEQLVRSVEYPVIEDEFLSQRKALGIALISLVIVSILGIILWTHGKKRHLPAIPIPSDAEAPLRGEAVPPVDLPTAEAPAEEVPLTGQPDAPQSEPPSQIRFCWKCGLKLPADSNFCCRCGTPVAKD
ncbi:MAG: hypothetical protein IKB53_03345 [Oscillospiraceae bacterium]|nr:hypothetical protein [Oscillospiraceae bacterium]